MADGLEHPLHLAVASLVDRQLDPVAAEPPRARGCGAAVVELDALARAAQRIVVRLAVDLDHVDLLDAVPRVREPVRERAVVREQQRSGRVGVEAADRDDPRLDGTS